MAGKTAADEQFLSKSAASNLYATKNHASDTFSYGIGTERLYGHVKLTAALNYPPQASAGIALQASAGRELNDKIDVLRNNVNDIGNSIGNIISELNAYNNLFNIMKDKFNELEERVTVLEHKVGS